MKIWWRVIFSLGLKHMLIHSVCGVCYFLGIWIAERGKKLWSREKGMRYWGCEKTIPPSFPRRFFHMKIRIFRIFIFTCYASSTPFKPDVLKVFDWLTSPWLVFLSFMTTNTTSRMQLNSFNSRKYPITRHPRQCTLTLVINAGLPARRDTLQMPIRQFCSRPFS